MKELENSVWEITRNSGTVMELTLLKGGYFEYENIEGQNVTLGTTYGGIDKGMTWNLKGKSITLEFNNEISQSIKSCKRFNISTVFR